MTLIEKLSEYERNKLMRLLLVPLITKTVTVLRHSDNGKLADEWEEYMHILVTLITTARQEIYDVRKASATARRPH